MRPASGPIGTMLWTLPGQVKGNETLKKEASDLLGEQ
jgi:hypothetical protein